jgi:hypothetical protein
VKARVLVRQRKAVPSLFLTSGRQRKVRSATLSLSLSNLILSAHSLALSVSLALSGRRFGRGNQDFLLLQGGVGARWEEKARDPSLFLTSGRR